MLVSYNSANIKKIFGFAEFIRYICIAISSVYFCFYEYSYRFLHEMWQSS